MVAVCNYVFDTLRQDAFRVSDGQLHEALCTVTAPQGVEDPMEDAGAGPRAVARALPLTRSRPWLRADIIRKIKCEWHYRPCSVDYYAGDAQLNAVLSHYVNSFREASLLVPLGGFRLLRNIQHIADGRCMVLVGDKAYSQEDELAGLRDPHIAIHGSFSFMVRRAATPPRVPAPRSAHTLPRRSTSMRPDSWWSRWTGLRSKRRTLTVSSAPHSSSASPALARPNSALLGWCVPRRSAPFPEGGQGADYGPCRRRGQDEMEGFGPENFSSLQRCLKVRTPLPPFMRTTSLLRGRLMSPRSCAQDETPSPSLKTSISIVRLSGDDPDVFYKFKQVFIDKAPYASEKQQHDVALDMENVYKNYYPLQQSKDVPFEIGRVFMGLKRYARAVTFFDLSQRYCGEHHVSWCARQRACPSAASRLRFTPNSPRYNTGICRFYTEEYDEAVACFRRALEMRPAYHDARMWLARVESKQTELSRQQQQQQQGDATGEDGPAGEGGHASDDAAADGAASAGEQAEAGHDADDEGDEAGTRM